MEEHTYLTRKDAAFLRAAFRPEDNFKKKAGLNVNESVAALIRKLAETHSQGSIVSILNEKGITRNNGLPFQQFHISRYFKKNGIKSCCEWRGSRNER